MHLMWKFSTPKIAEDSARALMKNFSQCMNEGDFAGMDIKTLKFSEDSRATGSLRALVKDIKDRILENQDQLRQKLESMKKTETDPQVLEVLNGGSRFINLMEPST